MTFIGFSENTEVLTSNCIKTIQDVQTEDIINGNKVTGIHRLATGNKSIYDLYLTMPSNAIKRYDNNTNFRKLTTTREQQFLIVSKDNNVPEWKSVEEIRCLNDVFIAMTPNDIIKDTNKKLPYPIDTTNYVVDEKCSKKLDKKEFIEELDKKEFIEELYKGDFIWLLGLFLNNGEIRDDYITITASDKLSILLATYVGPEITDLEYIKLVMKAKFNVEPTKQVSVKIDSDENSNSEYDEYWPADCYKLYYDNVNIVKYFKDFYRDLISSTKEWHRKDFVDLISGIFTIYNDPTPYCCRLYFKDYETAHTLCHIFNSKLIECTVHKSISEKTSRELYYIVLNHSYSFYKYYGGDSNSPRLTYAYYNFKSMDFEGKYYKFIKLDSIKNSYCEYVYTLSLDGDNTYGVYGTLVKGL